MRDAGPTDELTTELKLLLAIAGVGSLLLLLKGVSLLANGGQTGLLLGGTSVAVAVGQIVAFVALYRRHVWVWSTVLALLVTGAMLEAATGDWFGALLAISITVALFLQRDDVS